MKPSPLRSFFQTNAPRLVLAGIVVLAAFFRFYQITSLPPALHPIEANFGAQALALLHNHSLIFNGNLGATGTVFVFLQAIALFFLKNTVWSVRIVPALLSTLSVICTYVLARQWYGRRVGLLAAGLLAVNPWTVTLARDGLSASLMPFFVALSLVVLTKAYRSQQVRYAVLGGLVLAIGCYTYPAFVLLPVLLGVTLLGLAMIKRHRLKNWRVILAGVITFVILISPAIIIVGLHRQAVMTSLRTVSIVGAQPSQNRGKLLINNTLDTLLMFNLKGDENYQHNLGGVALLNNFVGIMFIIGLLFVATRPKRLANSVVVLGFGLFLLPAILSADSVPNALRAAGVIPFVFILAAVGVNYLLIRWYATFPVNGVARSVGLSLVLILLVLTAYQGYKQYFVAWAQDPKTYASYDETYTQMADYLVTEGKTQSISADTTYVLADQYEDAPIHFLTYKKVEYTLLDGTSLLSLPLNKQPHLFVLPEDEQSRSRLDTITAKYPGGRITSHYSPFSQEKLFYSYELTQ